MNVLRVVIAVMAVSSASGSLVALQPLDRPARPGERVASQPITTDARTVLNEAKTAYTTKPTVERMILTFTPTAGPARREEFVVRIDPGKADEPADDILAMDLGDLRVHAAGGTLTAIHTRNAATVYVARYNSPLSPAKLAKALGPMVTPQLAVMRWSPDASRVDLAWYAADAAFGNASTDAAADKPVWSLTGTCERGTVAMTIDGTTSRITRITTTLAAEKATVDLAIEPLAPTASATWAIDTRGRHVVDAPWRLAEAAPPVRVGEQFPIEMLRDPDGKQSELKTLLIRPGPPPNAAALALVFVTDSSPMDAALSAQLPLANAAREAIRHAGEHDAAAKDGGQHIEPAVAALVSVLAAEPPAEKLAALQAAAKARWGDAFSPAGVRFAWPAKRTLHRFLPEANSAIVVLDDQLKVLGVIPLDGRQDDTKALAAEIRAALPKKKTAG